MKMFYQRFGVWRSSILKFGSVILISNSFRPAVITIWSQTFLSSKSLMQPLRRQKLTEIVSRDFLNRKYQTRNPFDVPNLLNWKNWNRNLCDVCHWLILPMWSHYLPRAMMGHSRNVRMCIVKNCTTWAILSVTKTPMTQIKWYTIFHLTSYLTLRNHCWRRDWTSPSLQVNWILRITWLPSNCSSKT